MLIYDVACVRMRTRNVYPPTGIANTYMFHHTKNIRALCLFLIRKLKIILFFIVTYSCLSADDQFVQPNLNSGKITYCESMYGESIRWKQLDFQKHGAKIFIIFVAINGKRICSFVESHEPAAIT